MSPPNLNLLHIMQNETQASEPILFILSLGADPSQELQDLAKSTIGADKYHQVCYIVHHVCNVCLMCDSSSVCALAIVDDAFCSLIVSCLTMYVLLLVSSTFPPLGI